MVIKAKIQKRELSKINIGKMCQSVKRYPILLYCNDRNKVYYISTEFTTSNIEHDGTVFCDRELTDKENEQKSARLAQLVKDCKRYADEHGTESVEEVKSALKEIVRGKPLNENRIVDIVMKCYWDKGLSAGTRKLYEYCLQKVREFDEFATLDSVDSDWLRRFEGHLRQTMSVNGLSIPMRTLRSVFNWAKRKKMTVNYPFEDFFIKKARVKHIALNAQMIADLRDYPVEKHQEKYRDFFMLMFYLCGIDSVDLAHLTEVKGGRVRFTRQKNDSRSEIIEVDLPVYDEAREIIKKYRGKTHLLSWFDNRVDYIEFTRKANKYLKQIGYMELVPDKVGKRRKQVWHTFLDGVSTKTARRSFTTIARRLGVPEIVIGQTLGHSWASNTTQIYECFDQSDVDEGIRRVLDHVATLKGRNKAEICEEIRQRDEL